MTITEFTPQEIHYLLMEEDYDYYLEWTYNHLQGPELPPIQDTDYIWTTKYGGIMIDIYGNQFDTGSPNGYPDEFIHEYYSGRPTLDYGPSLPF
jgi:hypothetical protein